MKKVINNKVKNNMNPYKLLRKTIVLGLFALVIFMTNLSVNNVQTLYAYNEVNIVLQNFEEVDLLNDEKENLNQLVKTSIEYRDSINKTSLLEMHFEIKQFQTNLNYRIGTEKREVIEKYKQEFGKYNKIRKSDNELTEPEQKKFKEKLDKFNFTINEIATPKQMDTKLKKIVKDIKTAYEDDTKTIKIRKNKIIASATGGNVNENGDIVYPQMQSTETVTDEDDTEVTVNEEPSRETSNGGDSSSTDSSEYNNPWEAGCNNSWGSCTTGGDGNGEVGTGW